MKLVTQFLFRAWIVAVLFSSLVYANESEKLKNALTPILDTLRSDTQPFSITGSASLPIDGKLQKIS